MWLEANIMFADLLDLMCKLLLLKQFQIGTLYILTKHYFGIEVTLLES